MNESHQPDDYLTAKIDAVARAVEPAHPIGGDDPSDQRLRSTSSIASFADVPLHGDEAPSRRPKPPSTAHVAAAAAAHGYTAEQLDWATPEGIDVKPVYIAADRDGGGRAAIRWTASRASRRSSAGRTRRCTSTSRGPSGSTRASPPPRSPMRSTAATWPPARRGCRWRSTWPPTAATTPTIRACRVTSEWPGWQSIPSSTCASCSTASTCRRCRCR